MTRNDIRKAALIQKHLLSNTIPSLIYRRSSIHEIKVMQGHRDIESAFLAWCYQEALFLDKLDLTKCTVWVRYPNYEEEKHDWMLLTQEDLDSLFCQLPHVFAA